MNSYLIDLIARMQSDAYLGVEEEPWSSDNTMSWRAYREAETISDAKYIPELIDYLNAETARENREKAYFILAKIAGNTGDQSVVPFLLQSITREKPKIPPVILGCLLHLPIPIDADISPLIEATHNADYSIRNAAMHALGQSPHPSAEARLIEINESSVDEFELLYANWALQKADTKRALPVLMKMIDHSKIDISDSALHTIINITGAENLPLYIARLAKGKNKLTALGGVARFGGESEIAAVIARVKELVARKRKRVTIIIEESVVKHTELTLALEFLLSYRSTHEEIEKLLKELAGKKRAMLFDQEAVWLDKNIS